MPFSRAPAPSSFGPAAGFTLVEVLITLAIVAILLVVAVPAMQRFMTGRAVLAQAEELVATLRLARSDALRLNSAVTVCAATDTTADSPVCAAAANNASWNAGWLTFIDLDNDGVRDTGERVLRVQSPLKGVKAVTSNTQGHVRFYPNGLPATGAAEFNVQPTLDSRDSGYNAVLRKVQLNTAGRTVVVTGGSGS